MVPIIIVCYNNYKYVENTVNQIYELNKEYFEYIQILDNCSTCIDTINYLKNVNCKVIYNKTNAGPWLDSERNSHIYNDLPDKFILTDPDLEFNKNLPKNFIEILIKLSYKYNCDRIGFAIDISDSDEYFDTHYYKFEKQYWVMKIPDDEYELYHGYVDTTFCLVNKNGVRLNSLRIAGNFTAKHLPYYKDNKIYNIHETYLLYSSYEIGGISSITYLLLLYIENNYLKINKNNEIFFIPNTNTNLNWWKNDFNNYKNEIFDIFDKYLDKNKICIDIGSNFGALTIYESRKSKHIYCIEENENSFNDLTLNSKNNCKKNNYTLINKSIYNINDIINNYNINPNEISLINIDIHGNEEDILNVSYEIHKKYNIPLYISFDYSNWKDKNLDRFEFLIEAHKLELKSNPNISILFNNINLN